MEVRPPYFSRGVAVSAVLAAAVLLGPGWLFGADGAACFFVFLPVGVALLCITAVATYFVHERRRSHRASAREAAGLCVKCGYDLRHSHGDLCPECAMPIWRRRDPATGKVLTPTDTSAPDV